MTAIKNNKWIGLLIATLLVVNIATLVLLWIKTTDRHTAIQPAELPPPPGQLHQFIIQQLQLTEIQQQQFTALREQHHASQTKLVDSIKNAKDVFFDLLKLDSCSNELLQQKNNQISFYQQQLDLLHFNHFKQIQNICTPAQKILFDQNIKAILRRMANQRPRLPKNDSNRQGEMGEDNKPPHRVGERPLNDDEPPPNDPPIK